MEICTHVSITMVGSPSSNEGIQFMVLSPHPINHNLSFFLDILIVRFGPFSSDRYVFIDQFVAVGDSFLWTRGRG